jgi:Tripartite tricarboxylate transporter TctB family
VLRRVDVRELAFGLFLIVLASVAFFSTRTLSIGSAADMGPGFVPRALAWIILGFGLAFCVSSLLKAPEPLPAVAWRPLAAILASIALFAVLFLHFGLIIACIGAVLAAGAAVKPVRWGQLLLFGPVLAAFSALLFVKALGLPFKVWPTFLAQYFPQLGAW